MIDEKKLVEEIDYYIMQTYITQTTEHRGANYCYTKIKELVCRQPKVGEWIPVSERLPKERDSIFAKFKGTQKWTSGMFEKISDNVNVTIEFEDGKKATTTSHTTDGKWRCEKEYGLKTKVIAWQPLPDPYKEE